MLEESPADAVSLYFTFTPASLIEFYLSQSDFILLGINNSKGVLVFMQ